MKKFNWTNSNGKSGSKMGMNEIDVVCQIIGKAYDSVFLEIYTGVYVYYMDNGNELEVTKA